MKRESLRYDGRQYCSTLVCKCGNSLRLVVLARPMAGQTVSAEKHIDRLNGKIVASGWQDCPHEEYDLCPQCYKRAKAREWYRLRRKRADALELEQEFQEKEEAEDEQGEEQGPGDGVSGEPV